MRGRTALAGAAVAAAALVIAGPVASHVDTAWHGNDWAQVFDGHTKIKACDGEVDGNQVRAWWRWQHGNQSAGSWAPSGGCVTNNLPGYALEFRVCEHDASCSAYRPK